MALDVQVTDCGDSGGGVFVLIAIGIVGVATYGYGMYSVVPLEFCGHSLASRIKSCENRGYDDSPRPTYEKYSYVFPPEMAKPSFQATVYHDGKWVQVTGCSDGQFLFKERNLFSWSPYSSDTIKASANVIPSDKLAGMVFDPLPDNSQIFSNKGEFEKEPICFNPDDTTTIEDVKSRLYFRYLGNFSDVDACADRELCIRFSKKHWMDTVSDAPYGFIVMSMPISALILCCLKNPIAKGASSVQDGCSGVTDLVKNGCNRAADLVNDGCTFLQSFITSSSEQDTRLTASLTDERSIGVL